MRALIATITLSLVVLTGLWAVPSHAAVDWTEGFEYADAAAMWAVWDESCQSNPTISTDRPHSGAKSIKLIYRGVAGADPGAGGCFMNRYLSALSDTMYMRTWIYLDNFTPNSVGTKMIAFGSLNYPGFWWEMFNGQTNFAMVVVGGARPNNGTTETYTIPGSPIPQNQWACLEGRVTMNTPGVANGIIQSWVNDTMGINRTSELLRWSSNIPMGGTATNGPNSQLQWLQLFVQHGVGTIYYDDLVVSRDARVGCGGAIPPPDTVPPSPVTSPVAVANGGAQVTLTWVNGTDAGGVTEQNIKRCTGTSCTPTAILTNKSGINTSHVDTTVAAETTYGYAINNVDGAGNQGAYSSTAYVTTPTTYRNILGSDLFNRANSADLGSAWDGGYTPNNTLSLVSDQLRVTALDLDSLETFNTVTPPNDQWAQITLSQVGGSGLRAPGVVLRFTNAPTITGYDCRVLLNTMTSRMEEWTAGTSATLASTTAVTWVAGDKILCEAEGTAIRMYQIRGTAQTLVLSTTDATVTSGKTGIIHYVNSGTLADMQVDDFLMGSITATQATPAKILTVTNPATRTQASGITYNAETVTIRVSTASSNVVEQLSAFPGGVYTYPASVRNSVTTSIGFFGQNAAGVESTATEDSKTVSVPAAAIDTDPPIMTLSAPTATLPSGTTEVTIALTLNKPSICRYAATDIAYSAMVLTMDTASLTASALVTGLSAGTVNRYARCSFTDTEGTEHPNTSSLTIPITIAAEPVADTTAPTVPGNVVATALSQSQARVTWTASTDASGIFGYQLKCSVGAGNTTYVSCAQPTAETQIVTNLSPRTVINFVVAAIDNANNVSANSTPAATVTTTGPIDVERPSNMTNLRVASGPFTKSVQLTSDPGTDNSGSVTTTIEISPAGCAAFTLVYTKLALTHFIKGLQPNTSYCARGKFTDPTGNISQDYSPTLPFTTAAAVIGALTQPRKLVPFSTLRRPRVP